MIYMVTKNPDFSHSFEPIIFHDTEILILGSLPGKKSIELNQYYGHPRNRFWKILSFLTKKEISNNYQIRKQFLKEIKVGLWDVAQSAQRKGSLDSNIKDEIPNDVINLVQYYKSIKVIGFNGKKSESMYYKFFQPAPSLVHIPLPSSSPANMAINFDNICKKWAKLFTNIH